MNKSMSQAKLLKRRVRQIQGKAKFVGIIYLLGTIALLAMSVCWLGFKGSCLGGSMTPILTFYQPVLTIFNGKQGWTVQGIIDCVVVALYALMIVIMFINTVVALSKLNWLFKRRASYVYGFNRNMYAMDALAKCFSKSFAALVVCGTLMLLLSGGRPASNTGATVNMFGYIMLGVGLGVHFVGGFLGGRVTTFTTGKRIQEELRPNGLFMHVVRNLVQVAAMLIVARMLLQKSILLENLTRLIGLAFPGSGATFTWMGLVPAIVEALTWIFVIGMTDYALSAKEYSREGMASTEISKATAWIALVAIGVLAVMVLPMTGLFGAAAPLNTHLLLAVVSASITFLMNWVLQDKTLGDDVDEVSAKEYLKQSESEEK